MLARGRHQWAIILPQGDQFSFCRQEPQVRSIHRKAARGTAARHRSLLPAHTGRQPYQRAHCHDRLHRLRRSEVAHSSAGARIHAHTGCVASRGVTQTQQPRVEGARSWRVDMRTCLHMHVRVVVRSVRCEQRFSDSHAQRGDFHRISSLWEDTLRLYVIFN